MVDISSAAQSGAALANMPSGYDWEDEFGAVAETSFVRAKIVATTQVSADNIGLSQATHDDLKVTVDPLDGVWPRDDAGNAIPVAIEGTAYWVPGDTPPTESASIPPLAVPVGTSSVTATGPGDYSGSEIAPTSELSGYLVWVWSVAESDYLESWVEQYAESTQVVRVAAPVITSIADAAVALSDVASDVVSVSGPQMGAPGDLTWAAYQQSPGSPLTCDLTNQVFSSATDPLEVSEPGDYTVPVTPQFPSVGTYKWVATLSASDGSVIARGRCDDPSEATEIVAFSLSTAAVNEVTDGTSATDTAAIAGLVPSGATLDFAIYKQLSDAPECDRRNLVWRSHRVGIVGAGKVQSDSIAVSAGTYFCVATAYDRDGNVLQAGECGDPSEMTTALGALAFTGSDPHIDIVWIATVALVTLSLAFSLMVRRPRGRGVTQSRDDRLYE